MPYRITHVKACQGHDQSLIDKVGTAPLVKQIISLDYQFTVEDFEEGTLPKGSHLSPPGGSRGRRRVPCNLPLHFMERPSADLFARGIFPGATSCKGHVYMTRHAPWEIEGKGSWCQDE